ncbi:PAS domain-containing sensor histidine kinase [Methylomonas methanica]|uniref:histidine kinase n=1 Tax=Methylomonas methanica (strain DSM 25384 / MC09) TaxID=857087 RepID=G0A1P0_METMM|nr:PAS domain-containing sensor histidine kinase [Methylomonas methanica]AEG00101.1 PAS/PAC sensor signal transduction histidine kinase [Methylomonas methanica MC09]
MNGEECYVFNAASMRFCWMTKAALQRLGYNRQTCLSLTVAEVFPQLQSHSAFHALITGDEASVALESLLQPLRGASYLMLLELDGFSDRGNRYIHVRASTALPLSDSRHHLQLTQFVMDNVSIEVYWLDSGGYIRYANRQACQALGYSQKEILHKRIDDIDPVYPIHLWREHWQVLKQQKLIYLETQHQNKGGKLYPVTVMANYVRLGEAEYNIAFARDISKVKSYEARFSQLVSVVNVIIWSCNAELVVDYVSPQVLEIVGLPADNFIGRELKNFVGSEYFHPEDRSILLEAVEGLQRWGTAVKDLQHRIKNAAGHWQWMGLSMSAIFDDNAELQQVVGSVHDISLQKQEEDRLLSLNAELDKRVRRELENNQKSNLLLQQQAKLVAMGEVIGNIAHQWRQPLNALAVIMMNLDDALAYDEADKETMHRGLVRSQEILSGMSRTIDEFRGFFKNDKVLVETELAEPIKSCMSLLQATMTYHSIKLAFVNPDSPGRAKIQVGEFSQVLFCLINNAKEQLLAKNITNGEISVILEINESSTVIHVIDNAGGIDEQNLPKIFDPYFTTKPNRAGLGLYFSNLAIQEIMNGRIEAKNHDQGARFSVYLPLLTAREQGI